MAPGPDDLRRAIDALAVLGTLDAAAEAAGCGRDALVRALRELMQTAGTDRESGQGTRRARGTRDRAATAAAQAFLPGLDREAPGASAVVENPAAAEIPPRPAATRGRGVLGVVPPPLTIHVDAGSRGNPGPSACAFVVSAGGAKKVHGRYLGVRTNNEAEYEGLLDALRWVAAEGRHGARVHMDSQLVVMQVSGTWRVKEPRLKNLVAEARTLLATTHSTLQHVRREKNVDADREVNRVLDREERSGS